MAVTAAFDEAVKYALGKLQLSDLKLEEKQLAVVEYVYNGRDVFGRLPTGYGKSICYQMLPLLFDYKLEKCGRDGDIRSLVIVVSPLVSLMTEQVQKLRTCGVP
jgi:superfamily II DNA helicase RecQ